MPLDPAEDKLHKIIYSLVPISLKEKPELFRLFLFYQTRRLKRTVAPKDLNHFLQKSLQ